jgi:hypothetical protein
MTQPGRAATAAADWAAASWQGGVHPPRTSALTVLTVEYHQSQQGAGGAPGSATARSRGGRRPLEWRRASIDTAISQNYALGGDGGEGGDGGNGFGGGLFNDAAASLRLQRCTVTENHANGGDGGDGGSDGEGIGGGIYNLGDFDFDALTETFNNYASTSHDDIFEPFA